MLADEVSCLGSQAVVINDNDERDDRTRLAEMIATKEDVCRIVMTIVDDCWILEFTNVTE